jgi:hypothetical protein
VSGFGCQIKTGKKEEYSDKHMPLVRKQRQIQRRRSYEITLKWNGFLMINLVALVVGLNSEPQNIE